MMNKVKAYVCYVVILITIGLFVSCGEEAVPKPIGYFRIDIPDPVYQPISIDGYPYDFEIPQYATVKIPQIKDNQYPYWINVHFKSFNATLYLSYRTIDSNLDTLLNDSWKFVMKHADKSDGISSTNYENDEKRVYGTMFMIDGMTNASPLQFYLIDSVNHFLRGAVYFDMVPNNDSLKPVIERLKKDVEHIVETTSFKR